MPPDSGHDTGLHAIVHGRLLQLPVFARVSCCRWYAVSLATEPWDKGPEQLAVPQVSGPCRTTYAAVVLTGAASRRSSWWPCQDMCCSTGAHKDHLPGQQLECRCLVLLVMPLLLTEQSQATYHICVCTCLSGCPSPHLLRVWSCVCKQDGTRLCCVLSYFNPPVDVLSVLFAAGCGVSMQTRGGSMTVSGVLQHIWNHEGLPGLFR